MFISLPCCCLQEYRGSVRPFVNFNAKNDAELLHRAMKGIGEFLIDKLGLLLIIGQSSHLPIRRL